MPDRSRVLFMCETNAAASQMAEAILNSLAPERFEASSAGITPVRVHAMVEEAMRHVSLDLSQVVSKPFSTFEGEGFDWLITIGDEKLDWPALEGATRLHWNIADPLHVGGHVEDIIEAFMVARNELYRYIRSFITSVGRQDKARS